MKGNALTSEQTESDVSAISKWKSMLFSFISEVHNCLERLRKYMRLLRFQHYIQSSEKGFVRNCENVAGNLRQKW